MSRWVLSFPTLPNLANICCYFGFPFGSDAEQERTSIRWLFYLRIQSTSMQSQIQIHQTDWLCAGFFSLFGCFPKRKVLFRRRTSFWSSSTHACCQKSCKRQWMRLTVNDFSTILKSNTRKSTLFGALGHWSPFSKYLQINRVWRGRQNKNSSCYNWF